VQAYWYVGTVRVLLVGRAGLALSPSDCQ
jgi:hypothetical protein